MSETRRRMLLLLACIGGSGMAFLDGTLVNVALPTIRTALGGGLAAQQWIIDGYLLSLAALVLVGGSLGDLLGRRLVFGAGVAAFAATSALCAIAPSAGTLIAARLLQGVAAALLIPNSLALLTEHHDDSDRAAAIGTWTAWTGIMTVLGPLAGGALVDLTSWRWVFLINVPLAAGTLWLLRYVPRSEREPGVHIDWTGAALCAAGLAGTTYALIEQPAQGWGSVLGWLVAGVAALIAFVVWEGHSRAPMMPLGLFRSRDFALGNLATLTLYGALSTTTLFLVLFLQQVQGRSALAAGAALLPWTVITFLCARRFGALADRIGARPLMVAGPLTAAAGIALFARVDATSGYGTSVLPGVCVFGLGMSMTVAPLTATVLGAVGAEHAGVASGISNAVARVGGLFAIALVGALLAAQFEQRTTRALGSSAAAQAAAARPFVVDARRFSASERAHARAVLRAASADGLRLTMIVGAIGAAFAGIVSLGVSGRRVRPEVRAELAPGGAVCGASPDAVAA